ncbi:unnamed protein product [Prunus armeniaca]
MRSEPRSAICPVLQLHARRSSSSSVGSAMRVTSPRGGRLQLTRRRKGTKRPTHCRNYCIGVVLNLLSVQWAPQPIGTDGPAACVWHQVGVATTRPDSPCHYTRRHATSRAVGGGALQSQPTVIWHGPNVAYIHLGVMS